MTGWMQKAIAWQLLEHGVLTRQQIHGLIDNKAPMICTSLTKMRNDGLANSMLKSHGPPGCKYKVYGLTRKGIELALELQASDVSGLRKPSDPLFKQPRRN